MAKSKRTNNDLKHPTQNFKDCATQTILKPGLTLVPWKVKQLLLLSGTCRFKLTLVTNQVK